MDIMEEILERREKLFEKLKEKNNKNVDIFNEYMKLSQLIESINTLIKLEIKFEDIDMVEFEKTKEEAFKNDILDPIYPYFYGVEFLRDEAGKYADKKLIYKYISDEIDKSNKFLSE